MKPRVDGARPYVAWRREFRTLIAFVLAYAGAELALRVMAESGRLLALQQWTAGAATWSLRVLGLRTVIAGCSIVTAHGTVTVKGACLPITPLALGAALLICASAFSPVRKALWCGALLVALLVANVIRIASVSALLDRQSPAFDSVHTTIAPVGLLAVALVIWLIAMGVEQRDQAAA